MIGWSTTAVAVKIVSAITEFVHWLAAQETDVMLRLIVLSLAVMLASCATNESVALAPESPTGLVALKIKPPVGLRPAEPVAVLMVGFDSDAHKFRGYPEALGVDYRPSVYKLLRLKPGDYVFEGVATGLGPPAWGTCYNGGTYRFHVDAGKVTYLGEIDVTDDLRDIATKLPRSIRRNEMVYVFDTSRVNLNIPNDSADWESELKAYLKTDHPDVTAPIRAGRLESTTFGTGRDLFGIQRLCGGYYQGSSTGAR